jgi:hypothetical protein
MLRQTRVGTGLDTARLGQALARPGMDTRSWISLASVVEVVVDPEEGVFVDVLLLPSGEPETVRLGAVYAGNGWGLYAPLAKDDEVLVAFPEGSPDAGGWIVARAWSRSDPPPSEVGSKPEELLLFAKPETNLRLVASGGGNVVVEARDAGKVFLGADNLTALDGVVHGSGVDPFTGQTYTALQGTSAKVFAKK